MAAALRSQILENAKFLFGADKTFQIITALIYVGQYGNIPATKGVLVEVHAATGTFQTYLVGAGKESLDEAMYCLHFETTKLIYRKLAMELPENAPIETGETNISGSLGW